MSDQPPAAPSSRFEDLIDVFFSPAELFTRRRDAKFGLALLILALLVGVIYFGTRDALAPVWEAEFQRGADPNATPEQLEVARRYAVLFAPVAAAVMIPIFVFLLGVTVWLVTRTTGSRLGYLQGVTIATFAYYPRLVEAIASAVQALLMGDGTLQSRFDLNLGVARFLDPATTGPVLIAVLSRIDLFTIWVTVLIGIGIRNMAGTSTAAAARAAALAWLIGAIPTLFQGLAQ